jgi:hypothetical protein
LPLSVLWGSIPVSHNAYILTALTELSYFSFHRLMSIS